MEFFAFLILGFATLMLLILVGTIIREVGRIEGWFGKKKKKKKKNKEKYDYNTPYHVPMYKIHKTPPNRTPIPQKLAQVEQVKRLKL